jgi:hypothetical protein
LNCPERFRRTNRLSVLVSISSRLAAFLRFDAVARAPVVFRVVAALRLAIGASVDSPFALPGG